MISLIKQGKITFSLLQVERYEIREIREKNHFLSVILRIEEEYSVRDFPNDSKGKKSIILNSEFLPIYLQFRLKEVS